VTRMSLCPSVAIGALVGLTSVPRAEAEIIRVPSPQAALSAQLRKSSRTARHHPQILSLP
jgi:hypothetical protein